MSEGAQECIRPLKRHLRPEPGRATVAEIDRRYEEGQRADFLHPWEQRAIKGGASSIFRQFEPALQEGDKHVISWSRPRAFSDPKTGEVYRAPKEPLVWVILGPKRRKARGGWSVEVAELVNRQDRSRYIRRKPPALATATVDDAESAHEQSNYQASPVGAVDELQSVDDETLATFSGEATVKRLLADREDVQERLAEIKGLPARSRIVELHKLASDRGIDVRNDLRAFERRLRRRLDDAA